MPTITWQGTEAELPTIAAEIAAGVGLMPPRTNDNTHDSVTVWLHGEMGMGKTTLMGHILRAIGLSPAHPVGSPTFSLVNEYPIGGQYFAHLDLYRLGSADAPGAMDEGLLDHREFAGVFIEWPTAVHDLDHVLPADFHLYISATGADSRRYELRRS